MISVIIPAYNEAKNLKRLLPLLQELSYGHMVEIIVSVGDCAFDYVGIFSNLNQIKFVATGRRGRANQMNDGFAASKGDVLVFLHADVLPPKGFFEEITKTLAVGYDAGFFSYRFDKNSFLLKINGYFTKRKGIFTGGGDQCLFIKRKVFEELGRFNENQVLMEDFEFFRRMKKNKVPYTIVNNDLIVSARKYEQNSYLRINLTNLLLVILFYFDYAPEKLKNLHNRLLRLP